MELGSQEVKTRDIPTGSLCCCSAESASDIITAVKKIAVEGENLIKRFPELKDRIG
jgi:hypothetical protein